MRTIFQWLIIGSIVFAPIVSRGDPGKRGGERTITKLFFSYYEDKPEKEKVNVFVFDIKERSFEYFMDVDRSGGERKGFLYDDARNRTILWQKGGLDDGYYYIRFDAEGKRYRKEREVEESKIKVIDLLHSILKEESPGRKYWLFSYYEKRDDILVVEDKEGNELARKKFNGVFEHSDFWLTDDLILISDLHTRSSEAPHIRIYTTEIWNWKTDETIKIEGEVVGVAHGGGKYFLCKFRNKREMDTLLKDHRKGKTIKKFPDGYSNAYLVGDIVVLVWTSYPHGMLSYGSAIRVFDLRADKPLFNYNSSSKRYRFIGTD